MPDDGRSITTPDQMIRKHIEREAPVRREMPLKNTAISVGLFAGMAVVMTERTFVNDGKASIEAMMTFPVPVSATLSHLSAKIDGRHVVAQCKARTQARKTYEQAVDDGKTAILHEELLRGVHMLSVGHVGPGKEVVVTTRWAMPLALLDGSADKLWLRIPTTVGDVYGHSPMLDSDTLEHSPSVRYDASLRVLTASGEVRLAGGRLKDGRCNLMLNVPIDLIVSGMQLGTIEAVGAGGMGVTLALSPAAAGHGLIDADLVLDKSGSMNEPAGPGSRLTKHKAVAKGLGKAAVTLRDGDSLGLWEYDMACAKKAEIHSLQDMRAAIFNLKDPDHGTETPGAIGVVLDSSSRRDLLLVTDGKSYSDRRSKDAPALIQEAARDGRRITVVLVGADSLEALVGQLAASTGGEVFIAQGDDVASAMELAMVSMRRPYAIRPAITGTPTKISAFMGGMLVKAKWSNGKLNSADGAGTELSLTAEGMARDIGAFAAGLALSSMEVTEASAWAESHGIVCHLTSLVLVDEAGSVQAGIPVSTKIPMMTPYGSGAVSYDAQSSGAVLKSSGGMFRSLMGIASPSLSASGVTRSRGILFTGNERASDGSPASTSGTYINRSTKEGLNSIVARIDWSNLAMLSKGDISSQATMVQIMLRRASITVELDQLAKSLKLDAIVVLLGLIAQQEADSDRTKARFARSILRDAEAHEVESVTKALGL